MLIPWLPDEHENIEAATLPLLPLAKLRWTFLSLLPCFMRPRKYSAVAVSARRYEVVKTHPQPYDSHLSY